MGQELIIFGITALCWVAGWVIFWRITRGANNSATSGGQALPVSIIIPARNEEHNLPVLLRSINEQSVRPLEVIVVDDNSTDGTAQVARQLGATVISAEPLPDGWRGKTWACHQGAQASRGEWLLFLDADTWFEPNGLEKILAAYVGTGALSVGPYHVTRQPYEQLSAFFNVVMATGTVPDGLFGQMLLVDRRSYRRVGGHEAVRGRTLENFFLAKKFRQENFPARSVAGRSVLSFRMYPNGVRELTEGWTKGFAAGAGQTPKPALALIVAWLVGCVLAVSVLPSGWPGAVVYGVYAVQAGALMRRVGSFRWYAAVLYPVPLLFYFIVFARSALRSGKSVTWKGREIRAD